MPMRRSRAAALRFHAEKAREAATVRGRFHRGRERRRSPCAMLRAFADERVLGKRIPRGSGDEPRSARRHADRNLTHLRTQPADHARLRPTTSHAMPVESPTWRLRPSSIPNATENRRLAPGAGLCPPGPRARTGHTASLVPGDPVLDVTDADVGANRRIPGGGAG